MTQQNPRAHNERNTRRTEGAAGLLAVHQWPVLHWLAARPVPTFWAVGFCAFGLVFLVGQLLPIFLIFFFTFFLPIRFIKKYLLFNIVTVRDGEYTSLYFLL